MNNHQLLATDKKAVAREGVLGYRSGGPGSIPGTTRKKSIGS
jgi:hypothetical protein